MTIKLSGTKTKLFVIFLNNTNVKFNLYYTTGESSQQKKCVNLFKTTGSEDINDRFRIDNPWSKWRN